MDWSPTRELSGKVRILFPVEHSPPYAVVMEILPLNPIKQDQPDADRLIFTGKLNTF